MISKIDLKRNIIILFSFFMSLILIPLLAVGKSNFYLFHEKGDKNFDLKINDQNKNEVQFFYVFDESVNKILKLSDREFLCGAVAAEMPAAFEKEALKAQAVACYTYFGRERNNKKSRKEKGYDFTANTEKWKNYVPKDQMNVKWGNSFEKYYKKISDAVDCVLGEVIEKDGDLILAAYHAISSGKTEKSADVFGGDLNYLVNVESPGDKLASGYESRVEVPIENFKKKLTTAWGECNFNGDPKEWVGNFEVTEGGMIKKIKICGHEAKGSEIRKIFDLRSSDFELKYDCENAKFLFIVKGYGHGVGMSQYGAQYMAKQGADYKQILRWYYPGTSIVKLY